MKKFLKITVLLFLGVSYLQCEKVLSLSKVFREINSLLENFFGKHIDFTQKKCLPDGKNVDFHTRYDRLTVWKLRKSTFY